MAAARKTTTARTTRETRVTSRASTAADPTAPAPSGMGLAEVVGIVTTLLLIAAIVAIDYSNAKQLGAGIFFS